MNGDATTMLTCRQVLDFVMAYLDGELDAGARREFERHLRVCPSCVNYLESYRQTVRLGKDAGNDSAAEGEFPSGLLRAIQAARAARP